MTAEELAEIRSELSAALSTYDWERSDKLGGDLAVRLLREQEIVPEKWAKGVLGDLRRKRRFRVMALVAEALIESGQRAPQVRRQYAQALIDDGHLAAAELVLQAILQDPQLLRGEEMEARGLLGRIHKQRFVNANLDGGPHPGTRRFLDLALDHYIRAYLADPENNFWHGINAVALLERASRAGWTMPGQPDGPALAQQILATLQHNEDERDTATPCWEIATTLEALVPAEKSGTGEGIARIKQKVLEYAAAPDADAFEIASTLRQFQEVWQLADDSPPGSTILPVLRGALLRRSGGGLEITTPEAKKDLETILGSDGFQSLDWYKKGLERCKSIARIVKRGGMGAGTAWLVNAKDFFPGQDGLMLLTNAHVVFDRPFPHALLPSMAQAKFQMLDNLVLDLEDDVVWTSPPNKLDATFIRVKGPLPADLAPMPISSTVVQKVDPAPRLYVIGHPGGGDLAFSLQDNLLIATKDPFLHYRTPTIGGSSGSPVFEMSDWQVVALHHAGDVQVQVDGQPGKANEGIAILKIQEATRTA